MFLNSAKSTIVIAGAGFGGLRAALDLNKAFKRNRELARQYNLYLIDQNDHHLFVPSVYEIATTIYDNAAAIKLKEAVAIPLAKIFSPFDPLKFHQAKITGLDIAHNKLTLNDKTALKYSSLILAAGSETNFYSIPGLKENSLTLGSLNSAIRLRSAIEKKFCELLENKKTFRLIIGGAGVTGVELSAELCGYIKKLNKKYQTHLQANITMVESQEKILPGFKDNLINWAEKRLRRLGIKIKTGQSIVKVSPGSAKTETGLEFPFDILVWSGGIKPNQLVDNLPFKKDTKGRVAVRKNFCPVFEVSSPETATECSNILLIGDNCCYMELGRPIPQTAQMAIDEGEHIAKLILAGIKNQPLPKYRPTHNSYIIPIGGKFAIADLGFAQLKGFWVWIIKELVFLKYLASIISWPQALAHWLKAIKLFVKND